MNTKLLKSFSQINNGIVLNKGEKIKTISPAMNVFAVSEAVAPFDFAIYDINQFLGALSLTSDNRQLSVNDDVMNISDGSTSLKYISSNPELIITPPPEEKTNALMNAEFKNAFTLEEDVLKRLVQAASIMKADYLQFDYNEDSVLISTQSERDDTNSFEVKLPCNVNENGSVKIDVKTLNLIPNSYEVSISDVAMRFKSDEVTYYIVLM